jgi:HSP20 family protein
MNPFKFLDDKNKKIDSFKNINAELLEKLFDNMQRMFENKDFKEIIKDMFFNNPDSNTYFILDYGIKKDISEIPMNREYVNIQKKPISKIHIYSNEREIPIDVIEEDDTVSITIEIPDVEKEDIKIITTEETLEINVKTPNKNYRKVINLPCSVKEKSTKITYKNGIFDIVIKRKKKNKKKEGRKVDIE